MLPNEIKTKVIEIDVLINQFYIASDLYKHEDNLNWSKLNHLLYIMGGLGAIFGFLLKNNLSNMAEYIDPLLLISFLGIMVSLSFFIAINAGVNYLQLRKKAVINIDNRLKEISGYSVICPEPEKMKKSDIRSPTRLVLRVFPIFILLIWIAVFMARYI